MLLKYLGAVMIITACGGLGFFIAASHKREVYGLQKLLTVIEYMEWELEYKLMPLPQLCRNVASKTKRYFADTFNRLADELTYQISPDVSTCMRYVLQNQNDIPKHTHDYLSKLGDSLGEYSIDGQLKSLTQLQELIKQKLNELTENQTQRLRCYQTLGICAGAALAILFV